MAILIQYERERIETWREALLAEMPDLEVRLWPDVGDPAEIEAVLTFSPERGSLRGLPNLRFIASTGAGVDGLLDPSRDLPAAIPIVRLIDEGLTRGMAEYVLATVLRYHRQLHVYETLQREQRWKQLPWPNIGERRVGLLGLGELGRAAAGMLRLVGFPVAGWARRPRTLAGVECYYGGSGLEAMLASTSVLVCLLPLTPETQGIIDARTLALLPRGACVINAGRGGHVVDTDLLAAIDSGHIAHATLDVFREEPLPTDHPFWRHPRITVTPHAASLTVPASAAKKVVENLRRARDGRPLLNVVDRAAGY